MGPRHHHQSSPSTSHRIRVTGPWAARTNSEDIQQLLPRISYGARLSVRPWQAHETLKQQAHGKATGRSFLLARKDRPLSPPNFVFFFATWQTTTAKRDSKESMSTGTQCQHDLPISWVSYVLTNY